VNRHWVDIWKHYLITAVIDGKGKDSRSIVPDDVKYCQVINFSKIRAEAGVGGKGDFIAALDIDCGGHYGSLFLKGQLLLEYATICAQCQYKNEITQPNYGLPTVPGWQQLVPCGKIV